MEMREGLDLGYNPNPTTLVAVPGSPWFTNRYVYWCLSALLLNWPLRVIIEYKTQYADYQVRIYSIHVSVLLFLLCYLFCNDQCFNFQKKGTNRINTDCTRAITFYYQFPVSETCTFVFYQSKRKVMSGWSEEAELWQIYYKNYFIPHRQIWKRNTSSCVKNSTISFATK